MMADCKHYQTHVDDIPTRQAGEETEPCEYCGAPVLVDQAGAEAVGEVEEERVRL